MKFTRLQISFVLLLFSGISNHVLLLPHLLTISHRDAWICVLLAYVLLIIWLRFIFLIMKRMGGEELFSWLKARCGPYLTLGVLAIFCGYFFTSGVIASYDLIQLMGMYYLPRTPLWIIASSFLFICLWAGYKGLHVIVYLAAVLLPFVWVLGHFVAIVTLNEKDYAMIFPVLIDGKGPVLQGTLAVLGGSIDILVLLLLQNKLEKPFTYPQIIILISLLMMLVLGPTLGSIASFGPSVASYLRYPAFEQWRLVSIGRQISHLDFLAVFQFLSGSVIKVSLCLFLLSDQIGKKSPRLRLISIIIYAGIFAIIPSIPVSDLWIQRMIEKYFYPVSLIIGISLSVFFFIISYFHKTKEVNY